MAVTTREFELRVTLEGSPSAIRRMLDRISDAIESVWMEDPPPGLFAASADKWREQKIVEPS